MPRCQCDRRDRRDIDFHFQCSLALGPSRLDLKFHPIPSHPSILSHLTPPFIIPCPAAKFNQLLVPHAVQPHHSNETERSNFLIIVVIVYELYLVPPLYCTQSSPPTTQRIRLDLDDIQLGRLDHRSLLSLVQHRSFPILVILHTPSCAASGPGLEPRPDRRCFCCRVTRSLNPRLWPIPRASFVPDLETRPTLSRRETQFEPTTRLDASKPADPLSTILLPYSPYSPPASIHAR